MKVYFTASLIGKREYNQAYQAIVAVLKKGNHQVLEHILKTDPIQPEKENQSQTKKIYQKIIGLLRQADLVVAEISHPSASVGHEISLALDNNQPVIALYQKGTGAKLLEGYPGDKLQMICYQEKKLDILLARAIKQAAHQIDIRFNFFMTAKMMAYLDWVAKERKIPRSVFIRHLLNKEMEKDHRNKQII